MGLVIETLSDDGAAIGLTKAQLEALAESRLRVARLYEANAWTFLHVAASRYAIQLQYRKPVRNIASGDTVAMRTFSKAAEFRDGTAAGIMLEVSKLLDLFLVEYLRVNESSCGQPDTPRRAARSEAVKTPRTDAGVRAEPSADDSPRTEQAGGSDGIRWCRVWSVPDGNGTEPSVRHTGGGVTSPRLLSKVEPRYSKKAHRLKVQGTVLVGIEVWEDGRAYNITVLKSLGYGLDEKAIEAFEQWRFKPGTKDGKPVKVAAQVQVSFKLVVDPRSRAEAGDKPPASHRGRDSSRRLPALEFFPVVFAEESYEVFSAGVFLA